MLGHQSAEVALCCQVTYVLPLQQQGHPDVTGASYDVCVTPPGRCQLAKLQYQTRSSSNEAMVLSDEIILYDQIFDPDIGFISASTFCYQRYQVQVLCKLVIVQV